MTDEEHNSQSDPPDEVAVGMNGKSLVVRGSYTAIIIVILALAIFLGWLLWQTFTTIDTGKIVRALEGHNYDSKGEHDTMRLSIDKQTDVLREQKQLIEEQNYMLFFASPKDKERLQEKVRLPPRYREMLSEYDRRRGHE